MLWVNVIEVNIRLLCHNVIPLKNLLNGLNYCIEMLHRLNYIENTVIPAVYCY